MLGNFSDLKPGSDERLAFWDVNSAYIQKLLEEINMDVFDGSGTFGAMPYRGYDAGSRDKLTEPYICLNTHRGSIAVCTASANTLYVFEQKRAGYLRDLECGLPDLVNRLRAAIKEIIG